MLVVLAERIREARVRIATDPGVRRHPGELRQVRPHLAGAEGAVQADRERLGVGHGDPERVDGLAGERSSTPVGDRHRQDDRQLRPQLVEQVAHGDDGRLRVQRVENRLDQQEVDTTLDKPARLLDVGIAHGVERRGPERLIVDVGRDRQRPVGGADGACNVARPVGRALGPAVGGGPRETRRLTVQFRDDRFQAVVRLRNRRAAERVGLDDVGTRLQIGVMDRADDIGARQGQEVVVALDVVRMVREPGAAKVRLAQPVALDRGPHRAVEDQDPILERGVELEPHAGAGHTGAVTGCPPPRRSRK